MRKILKNLISTGAANIGAQVLTFIIGAYYARVLGKDNFGVITLVQAILTYFTMITLFGLQTFGTREVSKNTENVGQLVGDIVSFRFIIAIICNILIFIISAIMNKDYNFKIVLLIYGLTLFPLSFNIDWFFNGIQEMQHNAIYNILKSLVPFVIILMFLTNNHSSIIPIASFTGLTVAAAYQFVIYFLKYKGKTKIKISYLNFRKYAIYGFPFLFSGVLSMVNNYMDRIVIGFTRGNAETGIYSAAYYPIMFLINVIAIIFTPVFPILIDYYHRNLKKQLEAFTNMVAKIVIAIALPISVGGILLAKEIILLVFKQEFIEAYLPLSILLAYIFILFIREIYGYQLNAWHLEKQYLKIITISALSNLILNVILTPKYGMDIAALITFSTELINLFMMKRCASAVISTKLFVHILKILPSTIIMTFFIVIMKYYHINVIIIVVISMAIYLLSIAFLKIFDVKDIKNLMSKN